CFIDNHATYEHILSGKFKQYELDIEGAFDGFGYGR
ncbi:MAG: hypothetical protein ACJAZC_003075, partial [Cryomorphaceae bacterium]